MTLRRPLVSVEALLSAGVLYLFLTCNGPFWRAALDGLGWDAAGTWVFALSLLGIGGGLYFVFLSPLATRWSVRPLLSLLFLMSAAASYYTGRYAVYIDRTMVANVLATHYQEARELITLSMVGHILLFGVLPAALLWWPRLAARPLLRAVGVRLAWTIAAALLAVGSLMLVFADFASLMRNHREVRYLVTPANVVAAGVANAFGRVRRTGPLLPVGQDARLSAAWQQRSRPALFVLVVGETARAQNFSLNGYERTTNPELAKRDVINFPHVRACGTSTEVSLPCMFSPYGRRQYDEDRIQTHQSLLHVLARAGFGVLWRDNQSGCKGVCEGLPQHDLAASRIEGLCSGGQCSDEVLLHNLDSVLTDARGNLFVVLHQLGSHGPAYFRRYPPAFKRFQPACESQDLQRCTTAEIRNAYDNSLLYTDHVLGRLIDFLAAQQDRFDTAMLYVSDHGESLGENGMYLHGMPYAIAPDVQLRVPMVTWMSPGFSRAFGVDTACLRGRAGRQLSHDNLFHSMLGLMDVSTTVYDRSMDMFADCRAPAAAPAASR